MRFLDEISLIPKYQITLLEFIVDITMLLNINATIKHTNRFEYLNNIAHIYLIHCRVETGALFWLIIVIYYVLIDFLLESPRV